MLTYVLPVRIWARRSSRLLMVGFVCGLTSAEANEPEIVTDPSGPLLIAFAGNGRTTGPEAVDDPTWICAAVALPDRPEAVIL